MTVMEAETSWPRGLFALDSMVSDQKLCWRPGDWCYWYPGSVCVFFEGLGWLICWV